MRLLMCVKEWKNLTNDQGTGGVMVLLPDARNTSSNAG